MIWAAFFIGLFVGGFVGLGVMCLCVVSGDESRREELMERNYASASAASDKESENL